MSEPSAVNFGMLTRLSVSLGTGALPVVKEALEHARQNPGHDPILLLRLNEKELRRVLSWVCMGNADEDDLPRLCAGSPPEPEVPEP